MNTRLMVMGLLVAATVRAATPEATTSQELRPTAQQPRAAHVAAEVLTRFHYRALPLDRGMSEKIFDRYLKSLDGDRMLFLQSDVDAWADARGRLNEALMKEDLTLPFALFNLYVKRANERYTYARNLLKSGFDFSVDEDFAFRRDKAPWATSAQELDEQWRKRVKNDWLRLKLNGKDDKAIAETLDKRYENFIKRLARVKSEDAFQIFMNAYTLCIDPHTNYLGPRASEDFDISMKLSLVGIGASLEEKDDYTTVRELIAGGPAARSGLLKPGDRILGVAQGENGPLVDVLGWRLDDTVALIRGNEDTTVVLDVLPADVGPEGKHKRIVLVRKKISLEEQAAKKSVQVLEEGGAKKRVGVITLPGFYSDFGARASGDKNFRSATRDVARLLGELKAEKVDAVLMDLRNNGGGSLTEAIELTGLFIDSGPVVMQRDAQGRVNVSRDTDAGVAWNGPLGVLINRSSASASEIFAAAIQDYGRGLVIGEPSFGKGTVQTLVDLDKLTNNNNPMAKLQKLGELKLTTAQFFRINGGTTQLRGVTPDVPMPVVSDLEHYGESSLDNALPWVKIQAADYQPVANMAELLPTLLAKHDNRLKTDKAFRYLLEDLAELNVQRGRDRISLNESVRRKEIEAQENRVKGRDPESAKKKDGKTKAKDADKAATTGDESAEELAAEKSAKNAKDIYLNEAVRILGDELDLLKARPTLAARAQPGEAPLK